MTLKVEKVRVGPCLSLEYAGTGARDGVPLLLLHGYTDSWRSFVPLLQELPPSVNAVAVSLRGHGDSDKPATACDIDLLAADVAALIERLGIDSAVVVGHSMGSLVAQRLAIDVPERVQGLVLIGALHSPKDNAAARALWDETIAQLEDPVDPAFVESFQRSTLARPVPSGFLDSVIAESLKVPACIWRTALRSMLEDEGRLALEQIAAPTLIIWGDQDSIAGRTEQHRLAARIPDATLIVHEHAGHAPHWEDPRRVAMEVASFVRALSGPAAARQPGRMAPTARPFEAKTRTETAS